MDTLLRQAVWFRAQSTCEYCRMPQCLDPAPMQIDHVIAEQHGGITDLSNLALACIHCNKHKGPNIASLDPLTGELAALYNPRQQPWEEHFQWQGPYLRGLTPVGRATVQVLDVNHPVYVLFREALITEGVFPPRN